jgi:hypothetical protein
MRHLLAASTLLALALAIVAGTGRAQPPAKAKAEDSNAPKTKVEDPRSSGPKVDPTDAAIAAALAIDPDVKMARAKIQLAEAELAKARQTVTLKVVTLKAKIDQLRVDLGPVQERVDVVTRVVNAGTISATELISERAKLLAVKGALALAEAEWNLLTAPSRASSAEWKDVLSSDKFHALPGNGANISDVQAHLADMTTIRALTWLHTREAVKGPIPARLRAALDKPVKLGARGEKVTLVKALEVFKKELGLEISVRPLYDMVIDAGGEELPVGAWFQLYQDTGMPNQVGTSFVFYVRDYGILLAQKHTAPPDAPTLTEFWKQKTEAEPKK